MLPRELVLYIGHEALKFINKEYKLNKRHTKCVEFIQSFTFMIKHKSGEKNVVVDALSRKNIKLVMMESMLIGFEVLKEYLYKKVMKEIHPTN